MIADTILTMLSYCKTPSNYYLIHDDRAYTRHVIHPPEVYIETAYLYNMEPKQPTSVIEARDDVLVLSGIWHDIAYTALFKRVPITHIIRDVSFMPCRYILDTRVNADQHTFIRLDLGSKITNTCIMKVAGCVLTVLVAGHYKITSSPNITCNGESMYDIYDLGQYASITYAANIDIADGRIWIKVKSV